MAQRTEIAPLTKTVTVGRPPEEAFRLYTEGIAGWWPLKTHSVTEERAETAVLEGREGGRIFERSVDGEEHAWGMVLVWDPPHRIVHTWHPGRADDTGQEVELRFEPVADGTRVELVHRGWENLGDRAAEVRSSYDGGWDYVLGECYGTAAGARSGT
jgi:uncharacterized protein YndB with AHSA1/START domain